MRQLVRFGTAGQVYRPGELIFPNRSGSLPSPLVPVGWSFGMRVGLGADSTVGMQHPSRGTPYGAINPEAYMGLTITKLGVTSGLNCVASFGIPGVMVAAFNRIRITAEGFGGSVRVVWTAGNLQYQLSGQTAFRDFLLASLNTVVGITMIDATLLKFEPPYPWEPFTTHATINDWVEELDLEVPENWFALTIAQKKAFLVETYGDG